MQDKELHRIKDLFCLLSSSPDSHKHSGLIFQIGFQLKKQIRRIQFISTNIENPPLVRLRIKC